MRSIATFPEGGSVPNLGDFTHIQPTDYDGNIDLLVGGTPCQSYSLAGLRKGLADPRGNLTLEFARLAYRTDARWLVWENVPGVLTSGNGADFASFLSLLAGWEVPVPDGGWRKAGIVTPAPGGYGLAWRLLDAQYTRVASFPRAVPQRRRRLILVGYLGSWEHPAKVLLDGEVRFGDSPPRRQKGQATSDAPEGSTRAPVTVRMRAGKDGGGKGALLSDNLSLTLTRANDQAIWWDGGDKADTLTCTSDNQRMPDCKRLQCVIESPKECMDMRRCEVTRDYAPTLESTDYKGGKTVMGETFAFVKNDVTSVNRKDVDVAPPTRADALTAVATPPGLVRRLLPCECERLMAMPDDYTRIPWRNKPETECPDAPRYKALGNSMVVSVMRWVGERIEQLEQEINATR